MPPQHDLVIEPFAGGAAYSLRYDPKRVILIEKNPIVAAVWRYLIASTSQDILDLPLDFTTIDELNICQEAKWLIGFLINHGVSAPRKSRSAWAREARNSNSPSYWSESGRTRIASQVEKIKHWQIIEGDYRNAPNIDAHWIIDPPYQDAGHNYPTHELNYGELANWCKSRTGYVVVHEANSANWLPFLPFADMTSTNGKNRKGFSKELLWTNRGSIE